MEWERIIDGTYKARVNGSKVVFVDGPKESFAYWAIYQTLEGSFFRLVIDHDGETVLQCAPLSDEETRTLLEQHAPRLVDLYFGAWWAS
ncbi:hypothetical protein VSR68_30215 [Paraburkholderia phymatum]|uniref:hypothetical protein n=1 Tax=Paraburkholderia phymatum TaxID=148447 RepID=UPI003170BE77